MKAEGKPTVERLVRDGRVALLISPGFGAGWSTWANELREFMLFDQSLVEAFERGGSEAVGALVEEVFGEEAPYLGGLEDLRVEWIDVGTRFHVHEYDGSETIMTPDDDEWQTA